MASTTSKTMRVWHRYLGYFLAGIMAVYAVSGVVMIFRNTDFLKREETIRQKAEAALSAEDLGKEIKMRDLKIEAESGDVQSFKGGTYNKATGEVAYKVKSLPLVMDKLTKLHKASSGQPLFFLNVFFGVSLLFFVVSSFWMFLPKTAIFQKRAVLRTGGAPPHHRAVVCINPLHKKECLYGRRLQSGKRIAGLCIHITIDAGSRAGIYRI